MINSIFNLKSLFTLLFMKQEEWDEYQEADKSYGGVPCTKGVLDWIRSRIIKLISYISDPFIYSALLCIDGYWLVDYIFIKCSKTPVIIIRFRNYSVVHKHLCHSIFIALVIAMDLRIWYSGFTSHNTSVIDSDPIFRKKGLVAN